MVEINEEIQLDYTLNYVVTEIRREQGIREHYDVDELESLTTVGLLLILYLAILVKHLQSLIRVEQQNL